MTEFDAGPLRLRPGRGNVVRWQRAVKQAVRAQAAPVTVSTRPSRSATLSRWRELRVRLWWLPLLVLATAGIGIIVSEGDWENLLPALISLAVLGGLMVLAVRWLQRHATAEWVRAYQLTAFAEANGLTSRLGVRSEGRQGRIFGHDPRDEPHRRDVVVWEQNGFPVETAKQAWGGAQPGSCRYVAVRLGAATPFSPAALEHELTAGGWAVERDGEWLNLYAPRGDALSEEHWVRTFAVVAALVGPRA